MRVKTFILDLGWLEIWLRIRFGRAARNRMRRYRPVSRGRAGHIRDQLLCHLADTFSPERPVGAPETSSNP
jgi:hypothetical protein